MLATVLNGGAGLPSWNLLRSEMRQAAKRVRRTGVAETGITLMGAIVAAGLAVLGAVSRAFGLCVGVVLFAVLINACVNLASAERLQTASDDQFIPEKLQSAFPPADAT